MYFSEKIIDKLYAHLAKILFYIFVDFLQINNHNPDIVDHLKVGLGVAELMLELSEQLYLHIGEYLHFVHDLVVTGIK